MTQQTSHSQKRDLHRLQQLHQVENAICGRLELSGMRAGKQVIRDDRGWRHNEVDVQHSWLILVELAFQKPFWLFSIKFLENQFRDFHNPSTTVQGMCTVDTAGEIESFFYTNKSANYIDKIKTLQAPELTFEDMTIVIDGVYYEYHIFTYRSEVSFRLNNPQGASWENWSDKVWTFGKERAQRSKLADLQALFPETGKQKLKTRIYPPCNKSIIIKYST